MSGDSRRAASAKHLRIAAAFALCLSLAGCFRETIDASWSTAEEAIEDDTCFRCPADAADYRFVAIDRARRRVLRWRTYAG